jgi:hypothetical protein
MSIVVYVALVVLDSRTLRKRGVVVSDGWALVVPIYLILRTHRAGSTPAIPIVWFVTFLVSISGLLALPALDTTATNGDAVASSDDVEANIERKFSRTAGVDVAAHCPDRDYTAGETFFCTATAQGDRARLRVSVYDGGAFEWAVIP